MACKSSNVRKSIVLKSRSSAGGPQIFCAEGQVSTKQLGDLDRFGGEMAQRAIVSRERPGAPFRLNHVLPAKISIRGRTDRRILRRDGTAAHQITSASRFGIISNAFPQQSQHDEIPVLAMDARAAQLDYFRAQRLEDRKLKLLGAVITQMRCCIAAGLQTIRADNLTGGQMLDQEVIANGVEGIFVTAGGAGRGEAFVELQVEDLEAQHLCGADFIGVSSEPCRVLSRRTDQQPNGFKSGIHAINPCAPVFQGDGDLVNSWSFAENFS